MPTRGTKSKSHTGLDYTTRKGSKYYTMGGHEVRPYRQKRKTGGFAFLPAILAGLLTGGVSVGTQKVLKKLMGGGKHTKRKH